MIMVPFANVALSKLEPTTIDEMAKGIQPYAYELRQAMRGIKFASLGRGAVYVYFDGDNYTRAKISLTHDHDSRLVYQVVSPHIINKRYDSWRDDYRTLGSIHIKTAVTKCKKFIRPIDEREFLKTYIKDADYKYRSTFNGLLDPVRKHFPYFADRPEITKEFMQLQDDGATIRNDKLRKACESAREDWESYKTEMEVMGGSMCVVHLNMDKSVSVYTEGDATNNGVQLEYTVPNIHELNADLLGKLSILQMQDNVDEFVNGVGVTLDPHVWGILV